VLQNQAAAPAAAQAGALRCVPSNEATANTLEPTFQPWWDAMQVSYYLQCSVCEDIVVLSVLLAREHEGKRQLKSFVRCNVALAKTKQTWLYTAAV
jgi:hypothetical protein